MIRYIHVESPVVLLNILGKRVRFGYNEEYPVKIDVQQIKNKIVDFTYMYGRTLHLGYGHAENLKYVIPMKLLAEDDQRFMRSAIQNRCTPYLNYNEIADANHPRVYSITKYLQNNKYPLCAYIDFANCDL